MVRPTISLLAAALLLQDSPKQSPKILDNPSDHGIGRKIEGLLDAHLKERKALVVFFTASDCPVSKLYRPGMLRFAKDATGRGAGCLLVYCNPADKPDATDVGFPVVHDRDGKISKSLGARRTTDTFVLDASGVLRYRGAIDDQYGIGYHRDKPTRKYLVDAFEAVLAGKSPEIAATEAPGCPIEEQDRPSGRLSPRPNRSSEGFGRPRHSKVLGCSPRVRRYPGSRATAACAATRPPRARA